MDSLTVLITAEWTISFHTDVFGYMFLISKLVNVRNELALENFSYIFCLQNTNSDSMTNWQISFNFASKGNKICSTCEGNIHCPLQTSLERVSFQK